MGSKGAENQAFEGEVDGSPADLFENSLVSAAAPFSAKPMRAGPGRPKGSANKRTLDMRALYLKSGFPHPLLWQGHMLAQGIDGVAALLGVELIDAAELLRKIAADAAPYIESKMPTKVELPDGGLPVLVVGDVVRGGKVIEARQDGTIAIDDDLQTAIVQNQALSAPPAEKSHGEKSHTEGTADD